MSQSNHRKNFKRAHEPGDFHELTFSCHQRRKLLNRPEWLTHFSTCIDNACAECEIDLVAFVFMPNHVHLLTYPRRKEPDFGYYLARLKQPFSSHVKGLLAATRAPLLEKLTVRERPGKTCFRFWMEGPGYDRNIFSPDAIRHSIDYIHMNPVRRGLCDRAVAWKWSSARYYHLDPPKMQFPGLPFVHGLPMGALDRGYRA